MPSQLRAESSAPDPHCGSTPAKGDGRRSWNQLTAEAKNAADPHCGSRRIAGGVVREVASVFTRRTVDLAAVAGKPSVPICGTF